MRTLLEVERPARYIDREINSIRKKGDLRICICFPEIYEVGMSHLGLRIIYGLFNSFEDVSCERFFLPKRDFIDKFPRLAFRSLETRTPLKNFDVLGFTLNYELNYVNFLYILYKSEIPLRSSERRGKDPLIVCGGALNPEPIAGFVDIFFIGEIESIAPNFIDILKEWKKRRLKRRFVLERVSLLEGFYVPSFYEPKYSNKKYTGLEKKEKFAPTVINKNYVRDLNRAYFPKEWIVPYVPIIHDRISIEIMRGCANRCKFCQARVQYSPLRIRKKEKIVELAIETYKRTGYEEISLLSLCSSIHPQIEEIVSELVFFFKDKGVNLSLPSIKYTPNLIRLLSKIAEIKKTSITLAPETGSPRLQALIGKITPLEEILEILDFALKNKYKSLKLYFILGLPSEGEEDILCTLEFILNIYKRINRKDFRLHLSFSNFVPKSFTPFYKFPFRTLSYLYEKQRFFKQRLARYKNIILDFHLPIQSLLETILSRGSRELADFLEYLVKREKVFSDGYDFFNKRFWGDTFKKFDIEKFAFSDLSKTQPLYWDHINLGPFAH